MSPSLSIASENAWALSTEHHWSLDDAADDSVTSKTCSVGSFLLVVYKHLLVSLGGTCKCVGSVCVSVSDFETSPSDELILGSDLSLVVVPDESTVISYVLSGSIAPSAIYDTDSSHVARECAVASLNGKAAAVDITDKAE